MINIIKQEIPIDESLKKKLEFICDFCNTSPTFVIFFAKFWFSLEN